MPELPEVELARRSVDARLGGHRIVDARVLDTAVLIGADADDFRAALMGARVGASERIGKNVLVHLEDGSPRALWFHLGMTGHVVWAERDAAVPAATRWWIEIASGRLCLVDVRKLGRVAAGSPDEVRRAGGLDALGPDALGVRTGAALRAVIADARTPIKAALMDQERIAGLGNIHAAEALWSARIDPEIKPRELDDAAWDALADGIAATLARGLAEAPDGESLVYVSDGGPNPFSVYGKEGEPCPRCGAPIVREVARGRSTFLCASCQRPRVTPKKTRTR